MTLRIENADGEPIEHWSEFVSCIDTQIMTK